MNRVCKGVCCILLTLCILFTLFPFSVRAYSATKPVPKLTGNMAQDVANIALSQVGYSEDSRGGTAYGAWWTTVTNWGYDYTTTDWCGIFACWCANQAGAQLDEAYGISSAIVSEFFSFLETNGKVETQFASTPAAGDFIFFTDGDGLSHVAVVVSYDAASNAVTFVGGNQSDGVTQITTDWSASGGDGYLTVAGYGRPNCYSGVLPTANVWISESAMGDPLDKTQTEKFYYLCYEIRDGYTGKLLDSVSDLSYQVSTSILLPDGSCGAEGTHSNDRNSLRLLHWDPGVYTYCVEICGDITYSNDISHTAAIDGIYSSVADCSLERGGQTQQDIYIYPTGKNAASATVSFAVKGDCIRCSWSEIGDDYRVLQVKALATGSATVTLTSRHSKTGKVLSTSAIKVTVTNKKYTITYNANGGTNAPAAQQKIYNTPLTLRTAKPKRSGYTFLGWSPEAKATKPTYRSGGTLRRNTKTTLYAVWVKTSDIFQLTASPKTRYAIAGKTVQFQVSALGQGLSYQWQYRTSEKADWVNSNATGNKTDTLRINAACWRHGYQYRCVIKDKYGNVIRSNAATLRVFGIKTQPADKNLALGKTASFTVKVTGIGLTYQWQYRTSSKGSWKNSPASGNKTATLKVPATAGRNGYQYRCVVTDKYGNVLYSKAATLQVFGIKTQPANKNLALGKTASFTVKVTGIGLTYQWQYRTSSKGSWKNSPAGGNKTATLKIPVTAGRNGYQYRCVVTDKYGNVLYSNAAALKIK